MNSHQNFLDSFMENARHRPAFRTPKPNYNTRTPEQIELQIEESKSIMHTYTETLDGIDVWGWDE